MKMTEKLIIIATKNKGKVKEFQALLEPRGVKVTSLLDYEPIPDVEETGATFAENAELKALAMAKYFQKPVIADDSGLIVDALNGAPGIYSARYAGEEKNDAKNNEKLLREMKDVEDDKRTARFHCAICVAFPNGKSYLFEGSCEGMIAKEPKGENGFGYDPLFYIPHLKKTMAQLTEREKNQISHRAKAIEKLAAHWEEIF